MKVILFLLLLSIFLPLSSPFQHTIPSASGYHLKLKSFRGLSSGSHTCRNDRRMQSLKVSTNNENINTSVNETSSKSDTGIEELYSYPRGQGPLLNQTIIDSPEKKRKRDIVRAFIKENWLIMGELIVISLAKLAPWIGATGGPLRPEITVSKIGVFIIFFINGIALSLVPGSAAEMQTATRTNALIQLYNIVFIPLVARLLVPFYPNPVFRDGLLVLSCLPLTINIAVAQTFAAGGSMTTAIFNAIFANVMGVFLTPLLVIWMLGAHGTVDLWGTLSKLGTVVILPLVLGQICRRTPMLKWFEKYKSQTRLLSSFLILAIVYNIFADTFMRGIGVTGSSLIQLAITMPIAYSSFSLFFWVLSKKLLPGLDAPTRAAGLLCSSQKTLAFGIPFIKTALGHRPDLAYILAPLLLYAPSQLLLGSSVIVPLMRNLIQKSQNYESGGGI